MQCITLNLCVLFMSLQPCEGKSTLNEQIHWADGFVVVYDISDRSSFITATAIVHLIRELNLGAAKRYECPKTNVDLEDGAIFFFLHSLDAFYV